MTKTSTRMKEPTRQNLERLIVLVKARLAALPSHGEGYRTAEAELVSGLKAEEAAKFSFAYGSDCVALGGTRGTSTNGNVGALENWVRAAERRLAKAGAQ